ncbi:MAG: SDR family oxidoreductase [Actinobacteria bacterium]|nr:SDR family oxidoreductase [Actinomycetota bacterium]
MAAEKTGKRALVTGGCGFIGSHLCDELLRRDYQVVCVDNLVTGDRANVEGALEYPGFSLEEKDVTDPLDYEVDHIFHLASPASPVDYGNMPIKTMLANAIGTMNCLELARRLDARVLLSSTSEVYGDPQVSPQAEDYFGHVNPVGPRSCYDESKRFAEALCKAYEREHGIDVVIVRIFNTYGPRMRKDDGRVIPNFVCQALAGEPLTVYGDGDQTRSFCHVSDMVRGLVLAVLTPAAGGEIVNLGNPNEMRVIDLANFVRQKVGSSSPMEFKELPRDDPHMRRPEISKAMRLLGWAPEVDLEAGLDDVIKWFRERG